MKLAFTDAAWEDYLWFQKNQPQLLKRINELIKDAKRHPFNGIGKPGPLKRDLRGSCLEELRMNIAWCIESSRKRFSSSHAGIITNHEMNIRGTIAPLFTSPQNFLTNPIFSSKKRPVE